MQYAKQDDPPIQSRLLLKQSQKFWAKNDLNLLSDVVHSEAPIDVFKQTHVPQVGFKEVPNKVNSVVHCGDEALIREAEAKFGYRN